MSRVQSRQATAIADIPEEIAKVLEKVANLLDAGEYDNALEAIRRSRIKSPWMTNATGVCLLRKGEAKQAANLFHGLVSAAGGITMRADAPLVFKTNLATALLASENIFGCVSVLAEIGLVSDPKVLQVRETLANWKRSLPWWKRILWAVGDCPKHPMQFDSPLGSLGS